MKKNYETPEIEVIDVRIEKGFAQTNPLEDGKKGDAFEM